MSMFISRNAGLQVASGADKTVQSVLALFDRYHAAFAKANPQRDLPKLEFSRGWYYIGTMAIRRAGVEKATVTLEARAAAALTPETGAAG